MKKKSLKVPPSNNKSAEQLPDAELEVLACLWRRGERTAAQIRDDLAAYRPMAHGSVLTLLKRLTERGLVSREKGSTGKAFIFHATQPPEPTYRRLLQNLAERIFGGDRVEMLTSLLDMEPPTKEELKQMKALLDELRTQQRSQ